jgi:hypothetical protein
LKVWPSSLPNNNNQKTGLNRENQFLCFVKCIKLNKYPGTS